MRKLLPGTVHAARLFDIAAEDGFELGASLFPAAGRARGTVVIHGATGAPQRYYRPFAAFLAACGMRVLTYDFRGVGRSRPESLRGFTASMTDWARLDAAAIQRFVRDRHGDEPMVFVGHSFGGQLIGLLDEMRDAAGALLVATQLPSIDMWTPLRRALFGAFFAGIIPAAIATTGYVPGWAGLGVDLPAGVAREWASWCLQDGYLVGSHPDAAARFAAFRRPVLSYSFTDDTYAPTRSLSALVSALSGADLELRRLGPDEVGASIGHFGFFRPRFAARFWAPAAEWLEAVLEGRPPPRDVLITEEELARDLGYR
jgi:predicted alpha/beta hydrolase